MFIQLSDSPNTTYILFKMVVVELQCIKGEDIFGLKCLFSPSGHLKLFFGIAAVGTEQGHCYLVDMRLDDEVEEFDEQNSSHLEFVNAEDSTENVAELRIEAKSRGAHIGIELGSKTLL